MRTRKALIKSLLLLCLLIFVTTLNLSAEEKGTKGIKGLSSIITTATPQGQFEEIGMIYFFQRKETSVFGSDAIATLEMAIKTLEAMAKQLGADKVINPQITPITIGDPGLIVCGTAIKLK